MAMTNEGISDSPGVFARDKYSHNQAEVMTLNNPYALKSHNNMNATRLNAAAARYAPQSVRLALRQTVV